MNRNSAATQDTTIEVAVRVRPLLTASREEAAWRVDEARGEIVQTRGREEGTQTMGGPSARGLESFPFDCIIESSASNQQVYMEKCRKIVGSVLEGYNGTCLLYGQTKSGSPALKRQDFHYAGRQEPARDSAAGSGRGVRVQESSERREEREGLRELPRDIQRAADRPVESEGRPRPTQGQRRRAGRLG